MPISKNLNKPTFRPLCTGAKYYFGKILAGVYSSTIKKQKNTRNFQVRKSFLSVFAANERGDVKTVSSVSYFSVRLSPKRFTTLKKIQNFFQI